MKNRVIMVYASAIILLLSILLIILSYYRSWNLIINMGYGLFGSSCVTLLIYFTEYFVEKKKNFELFYIKCIDVLNSIGNIKYFDYNEQSDALIMYDLFKTQMGNYKTLTSFYNEMLEKAKKESPNFNISKKEFEILAHNHVRLFKKIASTYLDFMKSSFMELGLIIGDTKFLFPCLCKQQAKLRRTVYDYIMFLCEEVNKKSNIIRLFVEEEPSKISYKILKDNYCYLNNIFFLKKKDDKKELVYAKACNELYDKIERMRANFYHKKYIQKEHLPGFEKLL